MLKFTKKINKQIALILFFSPFLAGCQDTLILSNNSNKKESNPSSVLNIHFNDNWIIPVTVNDKIYKFLVDTGASVTVIDNKLAKEITKPLLDNEVAEIYQKDFSHLEAVSGKIDKSKFTLFKPVKFIIGTEEVRDNDIWIGQDLSLSSQVLGQDIAGIIGIDTIRKFNWIVDNKRQILVISKDAPPANTYQKCIEYISDYGRPPKFDFDFLGKSLPLNLDTGAGRGYLDNGFIKYIESLNSTPKNTFVLDNKNSVGMDATGYTKSELYIAKHIIFNKMPLGEAYFDTNDNEKLAVGMDFLSRFDRYAIMPNRMLFCYDSSSIERNGLKSQRSISIRYINAHIELFKNSNSNLSAMSLRNGDIINKVNGVNFSPEEITKVRHILSSTPQGKLNLEIIRDDKKIIINL